MDAPLLIALDVSTKPGFAFFQDGQLVKYGTLFAEMKADDFGSYPLNYINLAKHVVSRILLEVICPISQSFPGQELTIVIEETAANSKNCYSQKILEFIHFCLIDSLRELKIVPFYVRDGQWKNMVGARQNEEEKKINQKISRYKKKTGKKVAKLDLDGAGERRIGRLGQKHYSIRAFKEHFGIQLSLEEEDAAEAALLGVAFLRGVPYCDGTIFGGTGKQSGKSQ